jgi:hypothetical protein
MMKPEKTLSLACPAKYRIRIQGYLDNTWANQLGGMNFTNHLASRRPVVTVLTGWLIDQAELLGVLSRLYNLGFPLLSVECLEIGE